MTSIISVIQKCHPEITENLIRNRTVMAYLILDPSWYNIFIGSPEKILPNILNTKETNIIETIGRAYCFRIYKRRFDNLSCLTTDDDETTTDSNYSIHDTETDISSSDSDSEWDD